MGKDSFILYKAFYEPISELTDEQLGRLFRAIFQYQLDGTEDVDADISMAFKFFKNQFNIDEQKYQKRADANKRNGKKGGNPNFRKGEANPYYGDNKEITEDNPTLPKITEDNPTLPKITEDNPTLPKITLNDNDNDNDIEKKEKEKEKAKEKTEEKREMTVQEKINWVIGYYNKRIEETQDEGCRLRKVTQPRANNRQKDLARMVTDHDGTTIMKGIEYIIRNDYCNGRGSKRGRPADFDWLIKPENFTRAIEGNI